MSESQGVRPGGDQVPRRGGGHQLRAGRLQGGHRQGEQELSPLSICCIFLVSNVCSVSDDSMLLILLAAMADERLEQGGAGAGAAAAGRRVREGQLPVPRRHPAQVRQVGGQDRPAHGQEVSHPPAYPSMIRQSKMRSIRRRDEHRASKVHGY